MSYQLALADRPISFRTVFFFSLAPRGSRVVPHSFISGQDLVVVSDHFAHVLIFFFS
jgi:hypothetical protein